MPSSLLTDRRVASIKPGPARVEYFDSALPGFGLRVSPTGAKSWIVFYRVPSADGTRRELRRSTLGTYPDLSLVKAREKARDEIRDASAGRDRATERQEAKSHLFADLADEYLEKHAKRHKRSWRDDDSRLRRVLVPAWGQRPVTSIRRADVRELLEGIVARGAKTEANRTLALIRKMLNWALDHEWIEANPAAKMPRPGGKDATRSRVLTADEIRQTWKYLHEPAPLDAVPAVDPRHWRLTRAALLLRLITAQRGREVVSMRWKDIDGDWWTIPGDVSKNRTPHRVPLTKPAQKVLAALKADARKDADYIFEGVRGTRQRRGTLEGLDIPDVRPHDFRRTAGTMMASAGVPRLVVAKVLNHVSADAGVTAIYDRHSYDAEKRHALTTWATFLLTLAGKPRRPNK